MKASREFVEKYYADDLAEQDSEESIWARRWLAEVKGERILNIACGPQLFDDAARFAEIPRELVGVDLNETNIEFLRESAHPALLKAKKFLQERAVKVEFFQHDIKKEKKEFVGRFDTVYASGVLGMFNKEDTKNILKLIGCYIKPGGRFVMVSWGDDRLPPEKMRERQSYEWYWRAGPNPQELALLIEETGFDIKKQEVYKVANPDEYLWGIIYGFVAEKK